MSILHVAFYPSDWLAGTRGLSAEEAGVYITLTARIYEMAGAIERDDERLSRLCGCKTKARFVKCLEHLIDEGKIVVTPDGLTNERCEKEIKNATEKSSKAAQAANSRWRRKSNKNNDRQHADAMRTHSPSICQLEPEPELDKEYKYSLSEKPGIEGGSQHEQEVSFSQFWGAIPKGRKNGSKACAEKAWRKLDTASQKLALDRVKTFYSFTPEQLFGAQKLHVSTYLSARRFEDEIFNRRSEKPVDKMALAAQTIKTGKRYLCTSISASMARELIDLDMVTRQECISVGVL